MTNPIGVIPGTSTVLTVPEIAQAAVNAGIPQGQSLYTAVAIALAESGGKVDAVPPVPNTDGSTDYGVWQINSIHDTMLPGQSRFNIDTNAQLMAALSNGGTNWQAWTTYNNGAYLQFMPTVMAQLSGVTLTPGTPVAPRTLGSGAGVAGTQVGFFSSFTALERFFALLTTPQGWVRILKVVVGLIFMFVGSAMFLKDTQIGKAATKTAVAVATKVPV